MITDKTGFYNEYSKNTEGRDFICGDIHGCYTDLENALKAVSFDENKDRLFSVGDLADRGPESKRAIEFIKKPWFYPVLGNHEEMYLQCWVHKNEPVRWHYQNGGEWVNALTENELDDYKNELGKLPLVIRIGKVLICHSLLPKQDLGIIIANIETLKEFIIWQRDERYNGGPDGFITYAGHTINKEITKYGNVTDIDTGAFLKYWKGESGKLTVIDITGQE